MEIKKYRLPILIGVLGVLSVWQLPKIMENLNIDDSTISEVTEKVGSTVNISQKKVTANEKIKVSKDKIDINKLIKSTYVLQTLNAPTPFNNLTQKSDNNTVKTNLSNLNNSIAENAIPNKLMVKPNSFAPLIKEKEENISLKAIAQSNDKYVAVVEIDGKRNSAFLGSKVGDYQVIDISNKQITLLNNNGVEKTLNLND